MSATVAPRRAAEAAPMTHRQILEAMTGLLAALFTAMLSSTIVSVALPTIIGDLAGTQRQYTWVITAALLATTVSHPDLGQAGRPVRQEAAGPGGHRHLRRRLGRRRVRADGSLPARHAGRPGPRHGRSDRSGPGDHGHDHRPAGARPVRRLHGLGDGRQHGLRSAARRAAGRHRPRLALVLLRLRTAGRHLAVRDPVHAEDVRRRPLAPQDRLPRRRPAGRHRQPADAVGDLRRQRLRLVELADRGLPRLDRRAARRHRVVGAAHPGAPGPDPAAGQPDRHPGHRRQHRRRHRDVRWHDLPRAVLPARPAATARPTPDC